MTEKNTNGEAVVTEKPGFLDRTILDLTWWTASGQRIAYTVIAAFLPVIYGLMSGTVTFGYVFLMLTLVGLAAFLTALAGLPEVDGKVVPAWKAILIRVLKTVGQVGAASLVTATIMTDVDWHMFGIEVGAAALTTLVRTLKDILPETASVPVGNVVEGVVINTQIDPVAVHEAIEEVVTDDQFETPSAKDWTDD